MSVQTASAPRWPLSRHTPAVVIWHDVECSRYHADLPLWRRLAARRPGAVLEIGAGTGRVSLDLAARGHRVVALDREPQLLEELRRRAGQLAREQSRAIDLDTALADARSFELDERFALIVVPMQMIQLLGGSDARGQFLARAARHLAPGGRLAAALTERFDLYDPSSDVGLPAPDVQEVSGTVYLSQPTAVRREGEGVVLERRRERLVAGRRREVENDRLSLDAVTAVQLEDEARDAGLRAAGRVDVPPTPDHVGSVVVMLDA
jgi:SAM-dependent methyltransferase